MKRLLCLAIVLSLSFLLVGAPVSADPGTLYVDAAGTCGGNYPCYPHPQDAVNAANPGDTILVYPGTYGSREAPHTPPHWGPNNWFAPALIVYKDGLTIQAVDPNPANTVIQSTHNVWSNPEAIQWSTGGTFHPGPNGWDAYYTTPPGITPKYGTAPNAVAVIASNVTIRGFTLYRPFEGTWATYNTAGVMIGGLYAGYGGAGEPLGFNNNTVEDCVFSDVWHAVYIWHSSGNRILNNTVTALTTNHWAAISTYDGYNDAQIGLGNLSENNLIAHNTLANKGIALGAWDPPTWTSNAGSKVCNNTVTQVGVTYAHGPVIIGCNTSGFWPHNTDKVLRIKGVTYTGNKELWSTGNVDVALSAQLTYDGSSDGSGVEVVFTVDGVGTYPATTVAGGSASATANLAPGIYTIQTKVSVCDDCEFTDTARLVVGQVVAVDIKPGSYPNSINLGSKGVVPVAVLTTAGFDARTVNRATVLFAGASPVQWALEDVDGDGDVDMIFHFRTQDLNLTAASTKATLTGATTNGTPIKGTDTVSIVPKSK